VNRVPRRSRTPGASLTDRSRGLNFALAPGLAAHVHTEQDFAEVALSGTNDPASAHVTVPKELLLPGYYLQLSSTSGVDTSVPRSFGRPGYSRAAQRCHSRRERQE
jgi:hypothetical protein